MEKWTPDQLRKYQVESLKKLREYAYANSPFYKRFHNGLFDAPLKDLPILTKTELMSNWDDVVTDRSLHLKDAQDFINREGPPQRFKGKYVITVTGGTNGKPGLFVYSPEEWRSILGSYDRSLGLWGMGFGLTKPLKQAMVTTTFPWHQTSATTATVESRFFSIVRFDTTVLMNEIVAGLNAFQPRMVVTYPSMARQLAAQQMQGSLKISPEVVSTGAEVLTGDVKEVVAKAWGVRPFNGYGSTETGIIATDCPQHTGLHIFEDLIIPEFVDAENQPVRAGQYSSKTLVTVLFSRTLPLIRYELEDSVRVSDKACPCGRTLPLIDDIQGRIQEVIYLLGKSGGSVAIQPIFWHVAMEDVHSEGWQVIQTEMNSLRVSILRPAPGFSEDGLRKSISERIDAQGALVPTIELNYPPALQLTSIGKAALIKALEPPGSNTPVQSLATSSGK